MYAVVDPATGETVKEYPTITDDDLRDAVGRADRAHREWSQAATVADRASLVRRVGELYSERRKVRHGAKSTSARRSTSSTPTMRKP
jgi:succinate-semialdehyde dehydrogenase/glutarate-semialdehyde dehydrogenase